MLHEHFKFKSSFRNFPFCIQTKSKDVTAAQQPNPPARPRARPRNPSGPRRSPLRTRLRRSPHGRRRLSLACAPREPEAPRPIKGERRGGARPKASRAPATAPPERRPAERQGRPPLPLLRFRPLPPLSSAGEHIIEFSSIYSSHSPIYSSP
jgi:hypothetical protein